MNNRIFILIIAILVLGSFALIVLGSSDPQNPAEDDLRSSNTYGVSPDNVLLQEAYSLACPSCAQAHTNLKTLREEYKDRIVFQPIHFPLTARPGFKNALAAHRAVEAAAQQGDESFWKLHDKLLEERSAWVEIAGDPYPQFEAFAKEIGLNLEKFETDFRSEKINNIIKNDEKYLRDTFEIDSTPTFILNGEVTKIQWQDIEAFRGILDEALGLVAEADSDEAGEEAENTNEDEEATTSPETEEEGAGREEDAAE